MEKIKAFLSNYKSDILNVLGVVALIAVVVVGAVLFFGKDEAQPNIVEDTTVAATTEVTTTEPTTAEPETTTAPETTTKAAVTTTKAPVTTTKAPVTTTKTPANNTPSNTEQGTLPAGLNENHTPGDGIYEMNVDSYNEDARIMAAYEKIKRENIAPSFTKKGSMYWEIDGELVTLCERCGKPNGHGTHGTCTSSFNGHNCSMCGEWIPAGGCHTCKY